MDILRDTKAGAKRFGFHRFLLPMVTVFFFEVCIHTCIM